MASPAPPPYSTIPTLAVSSAPSTRNQSQPILTVVTTSRFSRPLPPQPTLYLNPAKPTRVRFRRTTLSPHAFEASDDDVNFTRTTQLGLGISDAPLSPEKSPIKTPAIEIMEKGEAAAKDGESRNIAHRIEQKLWKYSTTGNSTMRWRLEVISWLVSAISMAAIIVALLLLQNKPTPRWHGLTLNAYISEFSKIACAALLLPVSEALGQLKWLWFQGRSNKMWDFEIFDNASRGPWGSFVLLVRTKGTTLAALGAAITIFSMALDPFFQQLVIYPTRLVLNPALRATIPRVIDYSPIYDVSRRNGVEMLQLEQDLQAKVLKYLYAPSAQPLPFGKDFRPNIPLSCPTGNCTWPEYETLGVCSQCEDISDLLTYDCLTGPLDWIADVKPANGTGRLVYENGTQCGWFINGTNTDPASRPVLMTGYRNATARLPYEEVLLTRIVNLVNSTNRDPLYRTGSYHFKDVRNALLDFFVASITDGPNSAYSQKPPVAQECMLAWCVKTLKSTYIQANYTEEVTRTFLNTTPAAYPWRSVSMNTSFGHGYYQQYIRDIHLNYNGTEYGASSVAQTRTVYTFDDYFPSIYTKSNESDMAYLRFKMQYNEGPPFLRNISYNPFLAPNNVTSHMERMAKALTDVMRSSDQHEWIEGSAYTVESYVHVRWGWLSLPLILLAATSFFLLGTVVKSSLFKNDVGVWKTSAVATLLYGLPDDMQKKIAALAPEDGSRTPRAKAKELEIKMMPKKGWRASGALLSPFTPKFKPSQPPPGWI